MDIYREKMMMMRAPVQVQAWNWILQIMRMLWKLSSLEGKYNNHHRELLQSWFVYGILSKRLMVTLEMIYCCYRQRIVQAMISQDTELQRRYSPDDLQQIEEKMVELTKIISKTKDAPSMRVCSYHKIENYCRTHL